MTTPTDNLPLPKTLTSESAFAARFIRQSGDFLPIVSWLAKQNSRSLEGLPDCSPVVRGLINEILEPLLENATDWERSQLGQTTRILPHILAKLDATSGCLDEHVADRTLAVVMLPLYRSLGTAELDDEFPELVNRSLDALVLSQLVEELGDDLCECINAGQKKEASPHCVLASELQFDLSLVGKIARRAIHGFIPEQDSFDEATHLKLQSAFAGEQRSAPEWAEPSLMWRLAGQLCSSNANLVLPRTWIETPIPWQSVIVHWKSLRDAVRGEDASVASAHALQSITADDGLDGGNANLDAEPQDGLESNSSSGQAVVAPPAPTVLIAEVMSHNDPAFTTHLTRRIEDASRTKSAMVSAAIKVTFPANKKGGAEPQNRNRLWQQRLVEQLYAEPEIGEAFAFLTSEGTLLLTLMDVERGEATEIIRAAMDASLDVPELSRANAPTIYHAGLAATAAPSQRISSTEMIEPAIRCLDAAKRQPRSSIKSIEVF